MQNTTAFAPKPTFRTPPCRPPFSIRHSQFLIPNFQFLIINSLPLAAAALLAGFLRPLPAQPGPSRDINGYVLCAYESLNFNGDGGGNGLRGQILGGNVGVNNVDPTPGNSSHLLSMGGGGGSHTVTLSDGSQVVADSATLDADTDAWDLFVNILGGGSPPTVRNSGPNPFTHATATEAVIAAADLPVLPAFTPGATDFIVAKNDTRSLPPGDYYTVP